jgi:hypothetical protein
MVNQPLFRLSRMQSLLQCIQHQLRVHRAADSPTHDPAGKDVDDEGDVHEARPGGDEREIRDPQQERLCPLWPETVTLIKALLWRQPRADNEPVFISRYGRPLGASGVRYKLAGSCRGGKEGFTGPAEEARHSPQLSACGRRFAGEFGY